MSLGLCLRASDCENAWQVGLARRAENAGCLFTPPLLNSPRLVGPTCVGAENIKARTGPDSGSQRQRRTWVNHRRGRQARRCAPVVRTSRYSKDADRLARSTRDLLNTLAQIANKGAGFRSHADAWADTTTAHGRLMLTVLGGLAEFDRDLIGSRTTEGRERAKANAVKMGRPSKLTAHQTKEVIKRRDHGEETLAEIRQRPANYAERHPGSSCTSHGRLRAVPLGVTDDN